MAYNSIGLTVEVDRVAGVDAAARNIYRGLTSASGEAGQDGGEAFIDGFSDSLIKGNNKVTRAFDGAVKAISRVTELEQTLARQRETTAVTAQRLSDAEDRLTQMRRDATASVTELREAEDERHARMLEHNSAMQRQSALISQQARANKQHLSSIQAVIKAQDDMAAEQSMGQSLLSVGKMISALRAISIPVLGAGTASVAAQLVSVASAASQALWMIPAGAAAAAAGIGTVSLATMGFSDAIKDIGDPEKFAAAIQSLSPNAQQAALSIQALMEPLTALKDATQDAFFAGAADMINGLTNQYLPMVQRLTTGIADALNQGMRGVFDRLMIPENQLVIDNIVTNMVAAFQNLTPALAPLTEAILKIIDAGGEFLPEIANAAARAATSFSNFISQASASGDLERWFREGLDTIGQLWTGVKELAGAFADLAPAGREYLPPQIIDLVRNLSNLIPPLFTLLSSLAEPFEVAANVAGIAFGGIKTGLNETTGSANALLQALDAIKNALATLASPFTAIWNAGKNAVNSARALITGDYSGIVMPQTGSGNTGGLIGGGGSFDASAGRIPGALGSGGSPGVAATGTPTGIGGVGGGGSPGGAAPAAPSLGSSLLPGLFPTAGLPGVPSGGYAVPDPPPEKGSKSKEKAPPFTADPSLYSVDAIPVTALPDGLASQSGLVPNARNLNDIVSAMFPQMPAAGGWRPPDGFNEHSAGEAVDFMVGQNMALGDEINAFILQNAKALGVQYTIWRAMTQYPDGRMVPNVVPGGDPTKNHMDHVHARVLAGEAKAGGIAVGAPNAQPGALGAGMQVVDPEKVMRAEVALNNAKDDVEEKRLRLLELQSKGDATQRQLMEAENNVRQAEDNYRLKHLDLLQAREGKYKELDSSISSSAKNLSTTIGAALADDFGLSEGLPGIAKYLTTFLANLAFAPMMGSLSAIAAANPIQGGHGMLGMMGARNIAAGGSPLGLTMPAAAVTPGYGAMPAPMPTPMMPAAMPAPMMPGPTIGPAPLGGGVGAPLAGQPHGMMPGATPGPAGGAVQSISPQAASPGGGFAGIGGLPLQAAMTAAMGAEMLAPGASQAAQMGIEIANRTAGYLGQVGAIGIGGLMETFLPAGSEAADPSKSWVGRIAAGFAGARPALPNSAGQSAPAQTPVPQQQQQQGQNGMGPLVNIENLNNQTPDGGQQVANQIGRMAYSGYAARGGAR